MPTARILANPSSRHLLANAGAPTSARVLANARAPASTALACIPVVAPDPAIAAIVVAHDPAIAAITSSPA